MSFTGLKLGGTRLEQQLMSYTQQLNQVQPSKLGC